MSALEIGLRLGSQYRLLPRASVVTLRSEPTDPRSAPEGEERGNQGRSSGITVLIPGGAPLSVPPPVTLRLEPGWVVRVETSGGGRVGGPCRRHRAQAVAGGDDAGPAGTTSTPGELWAPSAAREQPGERQ